VIASRTTRHVRFSKSTKARCVIGKVFGWIKQRGGFRSTVKMSLLIGLYVTATSLSGWATFLSGLWQQY
jgi:hypothetical protein